ncbi:unnamed protein product, partial [Meganyctiphanes norvegica]
DEAIELMKSNQRERIKSSLDTLDDMKTKTEDELDNTDYKFEGHDEFLTLLKKQKETDLINQLIRNEMTIIDELHTRKKTFLNHQHTIEKALEKISNLTLDDIENCNVQEVTSAIRVISSSVDSLQKHVKQLEKYIKKRAKAEKFESEMLRGLIGSSSRRLFAVHKIEDLNVTKWSEISIQDDYAHVHNMHETPPPQGAILVPFCLLRDLLPEKNPLVFLDLHWHGEIKGRVYIETLGEELGESFISLCTGEDGWSYQNCSFYRSQHLNLPGEIIHGGDLEANDGTGSTGFFEYEYGDIHTQDIEEGLVVGWPTREPWGLGSFSVYLADHDAKDFSAFGNVVEGLDILKQAARLIPSNITDLIGQFCKYITNVSIADCGIAIYLKPLKPTETIS